MDKNTTSSYHFKNQVIKSQKEANSIPFTDKTMAANFSGMVQAFHQKSEVNLAVWTQNALISEMMR